MTDARTRNRGELSELYVLARLLSRHTVTMRDPDGSLLELPIHRVFKYSEGTDRRFLLLGGEVILDPRGDFDETVGHSAKDPPRSVPREEVARLADDLLACLTSMTRAMTIDEIPPAAELIRLLGLTDVAGPGTIKGDLGIEVYEPRLGRHVVRDFSIKSRIGGAPTLINASGVTRIRYRLELPAGFDPSSVSGHGPTDLVRKLAESGAQVISHEMDERLLQNLILIDGHLDRIVAEALWESFAAPGRTVAEVISRLASRNPLEYSPVLAGIAYKRKFSRFMQEAALGMSPAASWDGAMTVTGGFIDVDPAGAIRLIHPEDQSSMHEYVWSSTRFETPSTGRHRFGTLEEDLHSWFVNLVLQIRFI